MLRPKEKSSNVPVKLRAQLKERNPILIFQGHKGKNMHVQLAFEYNALQRFWRFER